MIKYVLLLLLPAVPVTADAADTRYEFTVQGLYSDCRSRDPTDTRGCMEYLAGVADVMHENRHLGQEWAEAGRRDARLSVDAKASTAAAFATFGDIVGICTKNYTGGQLQQIFINWAQKHPERWTEGREIGAMDAFHEAFPCGKK